jgi:hypothetical protein
VPAHFGCDASYVLRQGCYEYASCSGKFKVEVFALAPNSPTAQPTANSAFAQATDCSSYSTKETNSATTNTAVCKYRLCSGDKIRADGGSRCTGDSYYRLTRNSPYGGTGGVDVAENDDSGRRNRCAALTYTVPAASGSSSCSDYFLDLGCYAHTACSGRPQIQVTRASSGGSSGSTPSASPSDQPSRQPSPRPSRTPTASPSNQPSRQPSLRPSQTPTVGPPCKCHGCMSKSQC